MGFSSACRCFATAFVLSALLACEAPLVLEHVEAQRASPTQRSDLFQDVASNGDAIVVVGSRGALLRSEDEGATWQRQVLDGQPFLMDIAVCPDGQFVALAYEQQLWVGDQAGTSWRPAAMDTYETPQALTCDPRGRVWVVGSFSTILRSDDLGETWSETSLDEDLHFTSIQFVDENNAFMTGEFGVIVRTTDGGETWKNLEPLPDEFYPQAAFFKDTQQGWITGLNGTIWATVDGGATWSQQTTGTTAPLYAIAKNGAGLFAVGAFGIVPTPRCRLSRSRRRHTGSSLAHVRRVSVRKGHDDLPEGDSAPRTPGSRRQHPPRSSRRARAQDLQEL